MNSWCLQDEKSPLTESEGALLIIGGHALAVIGMNGVIPVSLLIVRANPGRVGLLARQDERVTCHVGTGRLAPR